MSFKFFPIWIHTLFSTASPLDKEFLWINFKMFDWFKKNLKKDMIIYEYGSGGSTFFISSRVMSVVSIEHDEIWYKKVKEYLESKKIRNCEYILVKPAKIFRENGYISNLKKYYGYNFEEYVRSIEKFEDRYFNIVFIDGRARADCIRHAIMKIRSGGYLILDNSQRKGYFDAISLLSKYERKDFIGLVPFYSENLCQTSVWKIE